MIKNTASAVARVCAQSLSWLLLLSGSLLLAACDPSSVHISVDEGERAATADTIKANRQIAKQLNLADQ